MTTKLRIVNLDILPVFLTLDGINKSNDLFILLRIKEK